MRGISVVAIGVALLLGRPALAVEALPAPDGAQADATAARTPASVPEKLICHREVEIGSLIAKRRTCMSARNWERNSKNAQDNLQELTKPGAFGPNG